MLSGRVSAVSDAPCSGQLLLPHFCGTHATLLLPLPDTGVRMFPIVVLKIDILPSPASAFMFGFPPTSFPFVASHT